MSILEPQDVTTAYPYNWTPPTGNLMYLMPQVGTQVSLYFYNQCESSARAVNCVRTNGDSPMMGNPEERRLLTEHGKQMHLYPESMGFTSAREGTPLTMMFDDTEGIVFSSHNKLDIMAIDSIMIEAPTVTLSALSQIQAAKADIQITGGGDVPYNVMVNPTSTLDMFNLTQLQSSSTQYTAWVYYSYPPFDDAPSKAPFANWALIGKVIAAVVVVAAVTAFIVVTAGAGAAAIPALTTTVLGATTLTTTGTAIVGTIGVVTAASGAKAVYNMAADEYYNANIHSLGEYLYTAFDVTYKTGSLISLPLNIWSLSYTLPKTLKSLADFEKWLFSPPPSSFALAGGGYVSSAGAVPQIVVSTEEIAAALGLVMFASSGNSFNGKTSHGSNQSSDRGFSDDKINDIINNPSQKGYQPGGKTVYAKKNGNFYDVVILNSKGEVITTVGGNTRSLRTWKAVMKMLNNNGGFSSMPLL